MILKYLFPLVFTLSIASPAIAKPVPLRIQNRTSKEVRVAIRVFRWIGCPPEGGSPCEIEYENGFWRISPGGTITPEDNGSILVNTTEHDVHNMHFYAESTDGSCVWSGDTRFNNQKIFIEGSPVRYKGTSTGLTGLLKLSGCE